jgi:hypothetical protein
VKSPQSISKTRRKKQPVKLSSGWALFKNSIKIIKHNKRIFGGVTLIYGVFYIVLVHGFSGTVNLASIKTGSAPIANGLNLFSNLLGSSGSSGNQSASFYQSVLLVLLSLAVIWVMRQLSTQKTAKNLTVKQAYYSSTDSLIPFLLVMMIISLQLVPMLVGASLYSLVIGNGLAVGLLENVIWLSLFLLLSIWSLYMVTASLFGIYMVTEDNRLPVATWRAARKLVAGRRWTVMRRVLFLAASLLVLVALVILPFAIWLPVLAEWIYVLVGLAVVPFMHIYLFSLYQELV